MGINATYVAGEKEDNVLTVLELQIKDAVGNEYGKPRDVVGEQRMAFTSHADASFDVCFVNHFSGSKHPPHLLPITLPVQAQANQS